MAKRAKKATTGEKIAGTTSLAREALRRNPTRPHLEVTKVMVFEPEMIQAGGHPSQFRKANGSRDRWAMEMHCNEMAAKWVNSLTEQWPVILREWLKLARAERQATTAKRDPTRKRLAKVEAHLDAMRTWERKSMYEAECAGVMARIVENARLKREADELREVLRASREVCDVVRPDEMDEAADLNDVPQWAFHYLEELEHEVAELRAAIAENDATARDASAALARHRTEKP